MVVSGHGLIYSTRQECFPLSSVTGECSIPRPLCRTRNCWSIDSIRIRALDEKLLLVRHRPYYVPSPSKGFVPRRRWIVVAASNPRVASSKEKVASKAGSGNDQESSRTYGKGQIRRQDQKLVKKETPATFSKAAVDTSQQQQQDVVKGGFAGLSALKAQLEQQRSGVSRVNIGDVNQNVGTPRQQTRAADQRREAEAVVRSQIAPKSVVNRGTASQLVAQGRDKDEPLPQNSNSEYRQLTRDGQVKKTAASKFSGGRRDSLIPNTSSSSAVKDRWEKEKLDVVADSSAAAEVRSSAIGERNAAETRLASADQKRSVGGGKEKDRRLKRRSRNRYVEAEQEHQRSISAATTPALTTEERDAAAKELGGEGDSPVEGAESADDDGKVTGKSVMEAFERVAAIRQSSRSKPKRKQGSSVGSDSDSDSEQRSLPPFVFKADWASRIMELENDVKSMRQLL